MFFELEPELALAKPRAVEKPSKYLSRSARASPTDISRLCAKRLAHTVDQTKINRFSRMAQ